ncbi:MAG: acyl-CoA dehydrogenase family protein [Chloroflexi bacterium]|nr:MAG: acyl-CoA dehydrogenase family protein [Chloroflexota bacterium]
MDFRLDNEQRLLCESARDMLSRECPPVRVKEIERSQPGYDTSLWRRVGSLGWLELAADHQALLESTLLCEELGRASAPVPFLSTALVARALQRSGGDAAERWLARLCSADAVGAVAITEHSARFDTAGVSAHVRSDGRGARLFGEKMFVADGEAADVLLVTALATDAAGSGMTLIAVDAGADGVERRAMATGPGVPAASVTLEGVSVSAADMLAPSEDGEAVVRQLLDDAAVLGSGLMLGHAAQLCDSAVGYAKVREQFGVPIGSFQAVQHRLADMATDVETLRALVYAAAWKRARRESDAELAAAVAKAWGAEALERVVTGAHQVLAGIGYTDDHDIQLHTRRAPWYAAAYGETRSHYHRAAGLLGL